jgi:hypothetical protein
MVLDWTGVNPLVTDPFDDQTGDPAEDIKAVYVSNDADNLYFRMELYHDLPVVGILFENEINLPGFAYLFFLDTMTGTGDPEHGGADYAIEYSVTGVCNYIVNVTLDPDFVSPYNTFLLKWNGTGWEIDYECSKVMGATSGPNIEVSVDWNCISGVKCFNAMFMAESHLENTDYAPDMKGDIPVTVNVCPCLPVAGELLPSWVKISTPYLIISIITFSAVALVYYVRNLAEKELKPLQV